jgi:hypothetical protein
MEKKILSMTNFMQFCINFAIVAKKLMNLGFIYPSMEKNMQFGRKKLATEGRGQGEKKRLKIARRAPYSLDSAVIERYWVNKR